MNANLIKIETTIAIKATPERVFAALTLGAAMWWNPSYLENPQARDIIFEPKVGGRIYEKWDYTSDDDDKQGALLGEVIAIKRPEHLRINGQFGMGYKIVSGTCAIDLIKDKKQTILKFFHMAVTDISADEEVNYIRAWNDLLGRLKVFVEEGHDSGIRLESAFHSES